MIFKISRELKIGIVAVVALVVFIWGFNFLKGKDVFNKQQTYYAIYNQIDGLVTSNPVLINGLRVGQVKDIYFHPDGSTRIIVNFSIENDIKVPANSISRIYSSDLMGSKAIQIILGDSKKDAQNGDTLTSEIQSSLQEEVNKQVLPLKRKTENLISSIDTLLASIQSVLNEKTRENLRISFESIQLTIKNLEHATYGIDTLVSSEKNRFKRIFTNIESISCNIKDNNEKVSNIINNFSAVSDSLAKINIAQTLHNADKSLKNVSFIIDKINRGEGSLGLLVNNDSLYNNLQSSAINLNLLIEDLRLNPHRYMHFSIFGRSPKKNKYEPSK